MHLGVCVWVRYQIYIQYNYDEFRLHEFRLFEKESTSWLWRAATAAWQSRIEALSRHNPLVSVAPTH